MLAVGGSLEGGFGQAIALHYTPGGVSVCDGRCQALSSILGILLRCMFRVVCNSLDSVYSWKFFVLHTHFPSWARGDRLELEA